MLTNFKRKLFSHLGIGLGLVVVLAGAILFFGADLLAKSEGIFSANSKIALRAKTAIDLSRLREESKVAGPMMDSLDKRIPDKDSLLGFSVAVRALTAKNGGLATTVRFGDESVGEGLKTIKFTINTQIEYASILKFLSDFDGMEYFKNASSINIIKQSDKYNLQIDGDIVFKENIPKQN